MSDTGCGISPEDLPKVKTKFYKANQTRRGSGIGLAIADEIVRLHDGELLIASTLGEGTCVTVRLPVNLKKGEMRDPEITTTKEISLTEIKERTIGMSEQQKAEAPIKSRIGGQALIEGVMMRGLDKSAMAVRKPDGELTFRYRRTM